MKPLHKGEPTDAQLRWLRAIHGYWVTSNGWYPCYRDLMKAMTVTSTNACADMITRLEKYGLVEVHGHWRSGVRLTEKGLALLKEKS